MFWPVPLFITALSLLDLWRTVNSIAIPNGVVGTPVVSCQPDSIAITFQTQAPFEGRIYVKGFADSNQCPRAYGDSKSTTPQISIQFNEACGTRRIRSSSGVNHNAVIIISFHRRFLTKVDKAYAIQCVYQEGERTVTQGVTVSDLTTSILTDQMQMPGCRYDVLNNDSRYGPIGAEISTAVVGQKVIHRWSCDEEMPESFCMRVYNCYADDGRQDKQTPTIDKTGCTTDQYAMPTPTYEGNVALTAEAEVHVFKFADRPVVYFQCSIELSRKNSQCQRPVCPTTPRAVTGFDAETTLFPGAGSTQFPGGNGFTRGGGSFTRGGGGFTFRRGSFTRRGGGFTFRGGSFTRGGGSFTRGGGSFSRFSPGPPGFNQFSRGGGQFTARPGFGTRFPDSNFSGFVTRGFSGSNQGNGGNNFATRFPDFRNNFSSRFPNFASRFPSFNNNIGNRFPGSRSGFSNFSGSNSGGRYLARSASNTKLQRRARRENYSLNDEDENRESNAINPRMGSLEVQHRLTVLDIDPELESWEKQRDTLRREGNRSVTIVQTEETGSVMEKGLCLSPISLATLIFLSLTLVIGTVSSLVMVFRQDRDGKKKPKISDLLR